MLRIRLVRHLPIRRWAKIVTIVAVICGGLFGLSILGANFFGWDRRLILATAATFGIAILIADRVWNRHTEILADESAELYREVITALLMGDRGNTATVEETEPSDDTLEKTLADMESAKRREYCETSTE